MKKVLVIFGSPHKGKTFGILSAFMQKVNALEQMKFECLHLAKSELAPCKSCNLCFTAGEESCPSKDDALKIHKKCSPPTPSFLPHPSFLCRCPPS